VGSGCWIDLPPDLARDAARTREIAVNAVAERKAYYGS
jgi:hypothetical protein